MIRFLWQATLLVGVGFVSHAQPEGNRFKTDIDSVALFTVVQDANREGQPLIRQRGFVSQFTVQPNGTIDLAAFRQHVVYLTPEKGSIIKQGINTMPGLLQTTYRVGTDNAAQFDPASVFVFNLSSGLKTPIAFQANLIKSLTNNVLTDSLLVDQTTAVDYNDVLAKSPKALGYRGDTYVQTRYGFVDANLVTETQPFKYLPFANRYVPTAKSAIQLVQHGTDQRAKLPSVRLTNPTRFTFYFDNGLLTIDSLAKPVNRIPITLAEGMAFLGQTEVIGIPTEAVLTPNQLRPVIGADWLFGPSQIKTQNPTFRLVRTDKTGKVVFDHTFTVSHEDYGFTQFALVSDAGGSLVNITLGKGLLKYQLANVYVTPTGVAWQRIWDKKDPAEVVRINGGNACIPFEGMDRLISLPSGETLLLKNELFMEKPIGYGALLLSKAGDLLRYISIKDVAAVQGAAPAPMHVMPLPDGRLLLMKREARDASASTFAPYTILDLELQSELGTLPPLADGKKTLLYTVNNRANRENPAAEGTARGPVKLLGGLSLVTGRDAVPSRPSSAEQAVSKTTEPGESNPFNMAPTLYLVNPADGKFLRRDLSRYGYSLPNQPFAFVNPSRSEVVFPVRTLPQSVSGSRKVFYPAAVYLKVVRLGW
jgi:hypothetical protein